MIAFASANLTEKWGGSEVLWSLAAAELARRGWEVVLLTRPLSPEPAALAGLRAAGVSVRCWEDRPMGFGSRLRQKLGNRVSRHLGAEAAQRLGWQPPLPMAPGLAAGAVALLAELRPRLLVVSQGGGLDGVPWMEAARALGVPVVPIVQAYCDFNWPPDAVAARAAAAYGAARFTVFIAERNREDLRMHLGLPLTASGVFWNPFQVPHHCELPWPTVEPGGPPGRGGPSLACVGRLEPREKAQDVILRVLSRPLWRQRNLTVTFYGGGNAAAGVRRFAAELDLPNVHFAGHVSDITEVWRRHHGLLLPSRAEGFPLSLIEAALSGRMAIATDIADHAKLVRHRETGYLVPAAQADLLDAALEQAWAEQDRWEALGLAAQRLARRLIPPNPAGELADALEGLPGPE